MVQQGDFEVKLVHAEDKTPFLEHQKDGKVYVEVEPDADYYIEIRRTSFNHQGHCLAIYHVDNQDLGFQTSFYGDYEEPEPFYEGVYRSVDGVKTMKALKFTKPKMSAYGDDTGRSNLLMGKVQVQIFTAVYEGMTEQQDFTKSFVAASVDLNQGGGAAKKKNLRTGEGSNVMALKSEGNKKQKVERYETGTLLDTITLNYCAALGLMEVGVLPKPDMWTYHRMQKPAAPGTNSSAVQPKMVRDAATGKDQEVFDLAGDDEE